MNGIGLKIGIGIVAASALLFGIFYVMSMQKSAPVISEPPTPVAISTPDLPVVTSTAPTSTPGTSTVKIPHQPALTPTSTVLVKCMHQEFTINILDSSHADPSSITVHVGDIATFVNQDSRLHWPGSDPHPTHSSLPSLDALGGISQGQSYSYTFKKTGKFGWHDHLADNPTTIGTLTVFPCST